MRIKLGLDQNIFSTVLFIAVVNILQIIWFIFDFVYDGQIDIHACIVGSLFCMTFIQSIFMMFLIAYQAVFKFGNFNETHL